MKESRNKLNVNLRKGGKHFPVSPLRFLGAHQIAMGRILNLCIDSVLLGWLVTLRSSSSTATTLITTTATIFCRSASRKRVPPLCPTFLPPPPPPLAALPYERFMGPVVQVSV